MTNTLIGAIPQRVHLIGVGGIHMSGIAQILRARGHIVSGSDLQSSPLTDRLEGLGVTIHSGHQADYVGQAELVVYTSAAYEDNPELVEARRRRIPTLKRAQMVARLMEGKQVIAVAGSHGKTTTSSLIAYMLWRANVSPTFMVGGELIDLGTNAMPGDGPHFVVEADEFDAAFLNYRPDIALVTNVEADHLDYYGSFEKVTEAFRQFLSQVQPNGYILACGDNPTLQAILSETVGDDVNLPVHVVSYSLHQPEAEWTAENISQKSVDGSSFMVRFRQEVWGVVETRLAGVHNVSNVLGAIATGHTLGLPAEEIRGAVAEFRGVRRRFEPVGEAANVTIFDDYAHHPTEVRATLAAARARFPDRRLVCLFQPHTYSRSRYLLEGFRTCFRDCDLLLIAETYAAREEPSAGMTAEELAPEIQRPPARYTGSLVESAAAVATLLEPGDLFFTMGAGTVNRVGPIVLEALKQR
ncbi:MAG: UDP-N-acetylmuramate--L-alanine ligase [Dehalococcoidia bacterium]